LAGADPQLNTINTKNDTQIKKDAEERKLHRMAKVHDFLVMWQGSQNLHAAQKESHAQNGQMTPWDTFRTRKRLSKHHRHSFNLMVRLHSHCQQDLLSHHLCQQMTSLEDELKYEMSVKSKESTIIQSKVMRLSHLKAFGTLKIGLIGMGT